MRINCFEWFNTRAGFWGFLAVIFAALTFFSSMDFFGDRKTESQEAEQKLPTALDGNTKINGKKNNNSGTTTYQQSLSTKPKSFHIIEGEAFHACGLSGLFITALHSGLGVATIGRKNGAFFDEAGDILRDPILSLKKPVELSANCTLSITDTYSVQGHSSFGVLIERTDK